LNPPPIEDSFLYELETVTTDTGGGDCQKMSQLFYKRANEVEAGGDIATAAIWRLLGNATSMTLVTKQESEPFQPVFINYADQRRSSALEDFGEDEKKRIVELSKQTTSLPLKTRLCDLEWVLSRDVTSAKTAVQCYLKLAKFPDLFVHHRQSYIHRALQLANSINNKELKTIVCDAIGLEINTEPDMDRSHFFKEWLALGRRAGIPKEKIFTRAQEVARQCCKDRRFDQASELLDIAANACSDSRERNRLQRRSGIAIYLMSRLAVSSMHSASELKRAIEKYRSAPGTKRVVSYMERKLRERQQDARSYEMGVVTSPTFDITPDLRNAEDSVLGLPFDEALLKLAWIVKTPDPTELREEVKRKFQISPLQSFCSQEIVDEEGRTLTQKPFFSFNDDEQSEKVIIFEMYQAAKFHVQFDIKLIDAARTAIIGGHSVLSRDLIFLVQNNPLCPHGREQFFLDGIYQGLLGNWVTSTHLLIPQIENALRYQFELRGWRMERLNSDGTQELITLQRLLYDPRINNIFDVSTVFMLKCLYADHAGFNLRNSTMHGLSDFWSFFSAPAIYSWWFVLHILTYPILQQRNAVSDQDKENQ